MAYIIGLLKPEEKEELERRGWEVEEPHESFKSPAAERDGMKYGMVFIDNSMLQIMSGGDWDKGPPKKAKVIVCDIAVTEREVEIPTHCPKCLADLTHSDVQRLRVWEFSDQERKGYIPVEPGTAENYYGINTGDMANGGGNNFIENVSVCCKCSEVLAEGKFTRVEYQGVTTFHVETWGPTLGMPTTRWFLYDDFDTKEAAANCMEELINRKFYSSIRTVKTVNKNGKTEATTIHTYSRGDMVGTIHLSEDPISRKKIDAKE